MIILNSWVLTQPVAQDDINRVEATVAEAALSDEGNLKGLSEAERWAYVNASMERARKEEVEKKRNTMNKWIPVCDPEYEALLRDISVFESNQYVGRPRLTKEANTITVGSKVEPDAKNMIFSMWMWRDQEKNTVRFPTHDHFSIKTYQEFLDRFTALWQVQLTYHFPFMLSALEGSW
jgi:hypothetical protein